MKAPVAGFLVAALTTAISVAPSLAQDAKIIPAPNNITLQDNKPDVLTRAGKLSESFPGVVIAIAKGQKEKLTAEQVGDKFVELFKTVYGVPARYETEVGADYTAIAFVVKGHFYGPYGLKEALSGMALAADNYDSKMRKGALPTSIIVAKPEPQH